MRDLPFGKFDNGHRRCGDAVKCTRIQDDGLLTTHPESRLVRVTVTKQIPLPGRRFAVETVLVVTVHEGDFFIRDGNIAKQPVASHAVRFENLAKIRFAPIAVAEHEVNRRSGKLRQDRRRADVAAMNDPLHLKFAEHEHRLSREMNIAVRVADNAEVHENFPGRAVTP